VRRNNFIRRIAVGTGISAGVLMMWAGAANAALPPGYDPLPGTVPINPANVGVVASQFIEGCDGFPRAVQPGEAGWHFLLPQSVALGGAQPRNAFNEVHVTFQAAGEVTVTTAFGPPSAAHVFIFTPTDDRIVSGSARIGRLQTTTSLGNDTQFNLVHTCVSNEPPTTTTTTPTATPTTTSAVTSTTTGMTIQVGAASEEASTAASGTSTDGSTLPRTGGNGGELPAAAIAVSAIGIGAVLAFAARRRADTRH
jgi:hypothetical protein